MTAPAREPYSGPGIEPVRLYLQGEEDVLRQIIRELQDAAAEAQRRINRLETKHGIGSQVERSQLQMVKRELHTVQQQLWVAVGRHVRGGGSRIAEAAEKALEQIEGVLFRATGGPVPQELVSAQTEYAKATVRTYMARGENGIGLSERVYNTKQLSNGLVDRAINREILLGRSWQDIAKAVRPMIDPNTPGGVSYAAKRLARTELSNAFHTTQKQLALENPWVESQTWNLSRSHRHTDKCDELARGHTRGLKPGQYELGSVPSKPHPQCLCYLTDNVMDEDSFLDTLMEIGPGDVARMYGKAARSA